MPHSLSIPLDRTGLYRRFSFSPAYTLPGMLAHNIIWIFAVGIFFAESYILTTLNQWEQLIGFAVAVLIMLTVHKQARRTWLPALYQPKIDTKHRQTISEADTELLQHLSGRHPEPGQALSEAVNRHQRGEALLTNGEVMTLMVEYFRNLDIAYTLQFARLKAGKACALTASPLGSADVVIIPEHFKPSIWLYINTLLLVFSTAALSYLSISDEFIDYPVKLQTVLLATVVISFYFTFNHLFSLANGPLLERILDTTFFSKDCQGVLIDVLAQNKGKLSMRAARRLIPQLNRILRAKKSPA
jgi:hypothetical protein